MRPAPFDYARPASMAEACALLAEAGGGATIIAGGQTLMPLLNLRMSQPFILVDITGIAALKGVAVEGDTVRIGPATRQRDALENPLLAAELPAFTRALGHVGHYQTRNRGTVGGSVALGEPAAEMPATAVALSAEIEIASVRGTRRVPARAFYLGPYMTVLEPDELVVAIRYPRWPAGHIPLFRELARRPGDFALAGVVGALAVEGGRIASAGLAWLAMGATPIAAAQAEAALIGQEPGAVDAAAIADLAVSETAPFDDHHASAEYRRIVGRRLLTRALSEALNQRQAA